MVSNKSTQSSLASIGSYKFLVIYQESKEEWSKNLIVPQEIDVILFKNLTTNGILQAKELIFLFQIMILQNDRFNISICHYLSFLSTKEQTSTKEINISTNFSEVQLNFSNIYILYIIQKKIR